MADPEALQLFNAIGMTFPHSLMYDEYERVGYFVQHEAVVCYWRLGDWCIYGEREYGERFYQAIVPHMFDPTRIRRAISTSKTFPHDTRRDSLSFEHYDEVASKLQDAPLHEKLEWLDAAERDKLTPAELGQRIRAATAIEAAEAPERPEVEPPKEATESTFRISFRVPLGEASLVEGIRHTLESDLRGTLQAWNVTVRGLEIARSDS